LCLWTILPLLGQEHPESPPSLTGISGDEQRMIESACQTQRMFHGPAAYYSCLRQQLTALEANPARPSLAGISGDEQRMIESACQTQRMFHGPAAYYSCLRQQHTLGIGLLRSPLPS
jgi:uncharacterized protein (DUF427 family)